MSDDGFLEDSVDDNFNEQGYLWLCSMCKDKPTFETVYELFDHKKSHNKLNDLFEEINAATPTIQTDLNSFNDINDDSKEFQDNGNISEFEEVEVGALNSPPNSASSEDVPLSTLIADNTPSEIKTEKGKVKSSLRKQRTVRSKEFKSNKKVKDCKQLETTTSEVVEKLENYNLVDVDKENEIKESNQNTNNIIFLELEVKKNEKDVEDTEEEEEEEEEKNVKNCEEENKESTSKVKTKHFCKICNTEFLSRIELSSHKKTHLFQDTGCYKCETCGKLCPKYDNFTRHLTIHLSDRKKPHQCAQCYSSFYNLADLKRHLVLHSAVKPFKCEHCGEGFIRQDNLLIHAYKHTGVQYKKFACKDCDKVLNSPSALVMHSKTHSMKTVFCAEPGCKFSCYLQSQLRQHLRKHSGEKPFQCAKCGRCFSRSNDMKNHVLNIHEGVKPFKCSLCPKQFALIGNLKIHSVTHTNERPYLCALCGKSFKQSSTFRKHTNMMHSPWRTTKPRRSKKFSIIDEISNSDMKREGKRIREICERIKQKKLVKH